jgi:hypothetical protein
MQISIQQLPPVFPLLPPTPPQLQQPTTVIIDVRGVAQLRYLPA